MDRTNLKIYLQRALELETSKFELEQTLRRLQSKKYTPKILKEDTSTIVTDVSVGFYVVIGAVLGFALAWLIGSNLPESANANALLLLGFVGAGVGLYIGGSAEKNDVDRKAEVRELNNQKIKTRNAINVLDARKKNRMIETSASKINTALSKVKIDLTSLYAQNVIYPKYRNFVAIATIFEYVDSGRCHQLDGADGAYNIFEMETRLDKIITKIDVVISKLEQIIDNQYYLYSAVKGLNRRVDNVTKSIIANTEKLDEVAVNTAVTAYVAQVIERNQYYGRSYRDGISYSDRLNIPR